jgi:hypothetical protein
MANEYIFFDEGLRDRFLQFAASHGLKGKVRVDGMEGYVVELPEDVGEDVEDALEAEYDNLMDEQQALVEDADDDGARDLAGVAVELPDGTPCVVRLPAPIARRLFEHFAPDEIHQLVAAVAASVANPTTDPLCHCE